MTPAAGAPPEPPLPPDTHRHRLYARLPALEALARWCAAVAAAEGLDAATAQALDLCLSELVANVIEHAGPVPVVVDARAGAPGLCCTVWDAGRAFDPLAHPAPPTPATLADAPIGGLGLALVRRFAHELHYQRAGDWNRLSFVPRA